MAAYNFECKYIDDLNNYYIVFTMGDYVDEWTISPPPHSYFFSPTSISCNPQTASTECNYVFCTVPTSDTKSLCTLPTEAQIQNQPYPWGLDPVWG